MNFATADRPRCMQKCEFYPHQYQLHQKRRYKKFDFYGDDEVFEDPTWYYNMNHQVTHSNGVKAKASYNNNNYRSSASNASNRSSTSGFQSFFRWFKKDDKSHAKDIRYPRDLTSSTDTLEFDHDRRPERIQNRKKLRAFNSTDTITPPSSPRHSRAFSQSSSCDSVFSTASSFAFVPPIKYLLNRNQKQVERTILDNPCTESYHKRVKARDRAREIDRNNEVTLRQKYHLYAESSDVETNNNNNYTRNKSNNNQNKYQDLSLPNNRRISEESNNLPDSAKLKDLNAVTKLHRRTSSDTSKDKKAGAFVHVKHKRKAPPPPPLDLNINTQSLTTKSSTGRKKRQAPLPPISPTTKVLEEASSATSLLGDKEIQAIIHGGIPLLVKNPTSASTPAVSVSRESPKMEQKRQYVSPYLKIREDRKLTDEQKRMLLEQVSKTHQRSTDQINTQSTNQLTIENGQLVYQRAESPKITKNDKDKVFAPSSPISPRPWYKRNNTNTSQKETIPFKKEVFLRTMEKRKKKDDKDLPEVGYSRNSFFESASKFNIFARLGEDSKKKEKDAEKRRSQIGIPNISELDREAAEIIQRGQQNEVTKAVVNSDNNYPLIDEGTNEKEEPVNARELIHKFEITSSHITRITVNGDFVGREDLFGKNGNIKIEKASPKLQPRKREESPSKTKLPVAINGNKKTNSLMGLWNCPYCTLENPNWKIICEACGKIKPYEKRFVPNESSNIPKMSPTPPRKYSFENNKTDNNPWDKKTELVKKYFHPQSKFNDLAKSSSETFIANSMLKKSPSPTRRYLGSPKMLPRKIPVEKPEPKPPKIESIVEESNENQQNKQEEVPQNSSSEAVKITEKTDSEPNQNKQNGDVNLRSTPDLNEIRSARLARFHTSLEIKKNQSEVERMNVTVNRKQSPEKKFSDKLDFSDPAALEREKERLRDKIRAMNAKALAEKYPVLKKPINEEPNEAESATESTELSSSSESSKLGAIKKVLKKPPLETRQDSFENQAIALEEKIINKESKPPEVPKVEKREKISISVQTNPEVKVRKKSEDLLPTTVAELSTKKEKEEEVKVDSHAIESPAPVQNGFAEKTPEKVKPKVSEVNVNAVKIQPIPLEAKEKSSPIYTNTIAINKILRHLEHAISEGRHDEAAQLAKDLARMKVPLHVTRQKKRPKSGTDLEVTKLSAYLYIKEDYREMEVNCYEISPFMTIGDLKLQISKDYYIPIEKQILSINGVEVLNDKKVLNDLGMQLDKNLKINVNASKNRKNSKKDDSESDDELQNEKIGKLDEAIGGTVNANKQTEAKNKIEDKGWECSLCTLINLPNRQQCLACSTSRPKDNKIAKLKELEYHLKVNEDLRTFFEMDKVDLRPKHVEKNDLNRQSVNRKSSDLLNIFVEDKNLFKNEILPQQQQNTIVMTAAITNPNITRNKYRGVDNFNPYKSYFFPKTEVASNQIRKPIITNVIYKSSQNVTKEIPNKNRSHYQELVSLEISDTVPNVDKFECAICFLEIEPKAGVCLRECLHMFCKICLEHHVKYSDEAEIKCPYIDDTFSCPCLLQEREIRGLVSKDEYEKHLSRSIRLAENSMENTYHCKTPNCKGWCIFEENLNTFKCPVCTIVNCITCGAIHDGLNCKQYQDHLVRDTDNESINQTKKLLQELIDKDEAMNCPTCHIFLLKKWGCDWLKCTFCKTEICWVTKQTRWGPGGKGDISGGCKCGVNGKKCSPKCTYCH
ncbi:putative leucine-rich repeat-containing protein DDB_G0290503 isoform X3 [Chironomus tepperi]|uniref:putative leucine-rich repeat-containing protein DDB_G0290503 isoform X3 n=1 Tax=Chironomus tepperi TaxID=113505 RepID=UPI00391EEDF5